MSDPRPSAAEQPSGPQPLQLVVMVTPDGGMQFGSTGNVKAGHLWAAAQLLTQIGNDMFAESVALARARAEASQRIVVPGLGR